MAIRLDCDLCGCTRFTGATDDDYEGEAFACRDCGEVVVIDTTRVKAEPA